MSRPKIGLALGSGGARGLAHIGVLKVLEKHGVAIDYLAGSSMGSMVAALYANGIKPDMMEKLALHLKRKHWLDVSVPKLGFVKGEKIKEIIRILTQGKNIEELSIPLSIVATDIEARERVILNSGSVAEAVRASISIPGIFVPQMIDGRMLVDGGVIDRVPITLVKEMGADVVIAVDVSLYTGQVKINSIFDVIAQTIDVMETEIYRNRVVAADLFIHPDVGKYSITSFDQMDKIITAGESAAEEMVGKITAYIAEKT